MKKQISDRLVMELVEYNRYCERQGDKEAFVDKMGPMIEVLIDIVKAYHIREYVMFGMPMAFRISGAEQVIGKSLRDDMAKKVYYKDIYQNVKQKVEIFAMLHGKSEVISKQLAIIE